MPRQIGRARAWVEMAALSPAWATLRGLPLERAVHAGAALGSIISRLDFANRPIAMRNLAIAFPEHSSDEHRTILRETYRNFGRIAAEWINFSDFSRANIRNYVTYKDPEYWTEAQRISQGRGILVLTGHFGNWELLAGAHSIYGYRVAIVHRPNRNPILDAAVNRRRERFGNRVIARRGAAKPILQLLREDWAVVIPLDLDNRQGIFVDFFSMQAATSDALARIAMSTGTPVLPVFLIREGTGPHHQITFLPAIEVQRGEDRAAAIRDATQDFTRIIEAMIRKHPDHWNWIHRRWKTRPPGESRFY
jgi:KDO2-lipid IV(A) lauroyltransferase